MTRHILRNVLAVAAVSALLAGCVGGPAGGEGPAPLTPTSRFSLQVEPGIDRIALAVHEDGVSPDRKSVV